jgi:GT2 family glycosyltransferase
MARNRGLALARHDWIINIDSDCIPPPEYLRRIREAIEQRDDDNLLIVGLRRFVCGDQISEEELQRGCCDFASLPFVASPSNYGRALDRRYPEIEAIAESPHPWAFVHSGNLIYRRDIALRIGGFDEIFDGVWGYEDIDFAHRLITATGARPFYLSGIECYHQDSQAANAPAPVDNDERFNKANNPNWARICKRILGFEQFKLDQYRRINAMVKL